MERSHVDHGVLRLSPRRSVGGSIYAFVMSSRSDREAGIGGRRRRLLADVVDVVVIDADVVLVDACAVVLTQTPSRLLQAIDAGCAVMVMSDQAFHEIGRMTAPAARWNRIEHDALRALITDRYLSRIPVVVISDIDPGRSWTPDVPDVADPKDVAHVQVARLASATAVYSHDKHLRRPGYSPATAAAFAERVGHLATVSRHREAEHAVGASLIAVLGGTRHIVGLMSQRVGRPVAWTATLIASMLALRWALATHERRGRLETTLDPILTQIGEAYARAASARRSVVDAPLMSATGPGRLEVRLASYLVLHGPASLRTLVDHLALDAVERGEADVILRTHPAFERAGRWGWSLGRIRTALETEPSMKWAQSDSTAGPSDTRAEAAAKTETELVRPRERR